MVGNLSNMKLQKDMIKKQIQNVDGVIDEQTKKEFEMVVHKNDILMRDFNKMSYKRIMLQKEYARILVPTLGPANRRDSGFWRRTRRRRSSAARSRTR